MRSLRLVFMGTPEFAVPMLETLHRSNHKIVGVVTAPDKPAGRGMKFQQSAVKLQALDFNLPILQPEKLKSSDFIAELKNLKADLFVVVAFRMLPEVVWEMPPLGTINLHASLLPQYRGAAPINHAILNGEKESGVTTFFIQQEIDTGKIIFAESTPISDNETAGELYQKLMLIGATTLLKTVDAIASGNYPQTAQISGKILKPAPKIFKDDCRIDWNNSVEKIHNQIRGLCPSPGAFTTLQQKQLKIFSSEKIICSTNQSPGSINTDGKNFLRFCAANGFISVKECQYEGKRKMTVEEFLRGNDISDVH